MRLTNKQLNLIVDMIYNNIYNEAYKNKIIKEKETFVSTHMKQFKASWLYKDVTAALKHKFIEWVRVLDRDLYVTIGIQNPYSPTSTSCSYFSSTSDTEEKVKALTLNQFKETNKITKTQIENEVILSMLNAKDINTLIENITSKLR